MDVTAITFVTVAVCPVAVVVTGDHFVAAAAAAAIWLSVVDQALDDDLEGSGAGQGAILQQWKVIFSRKPIKHQTKFQSENSFLNWEKVYSVEHQPLKLFTK